MEKLSKDKKDQNHISSYISEPNLRDLSLKRGPKHYPICNNCNLAHGTSKCYRCYKRRKSAI